MPVIRVRTASGNTYELNDPNWDAAAYVKNVQDDKVQQVAIGGAVFNKHSVVEAVPVVPETPAATPVSTTAPAATTPAATPTSN